MSLKLRQGDGAVLDEWELFGELGRRAPGEGPEVPVEVRLVVVAAVERQLAEAHPLARAQAARGAPEGQPPRGDLRWQAHLAAEALGEVAAAPAGRPRQLLDPLGAAGR